MSYVIPLIQARMDSERLPGKVMMEIGGWPMLSYLVDACKDAGLEPIVVTPIAAVNNPIYHWCLGAAIKCSRWPVEGVRDPLAEFTYAVRNHGAYAWVLRLTADCPMIKPHHISLFASMLTGEGNVFTNRPIDMDGYDMEACQVRMLRLAFQEATGKDREHVFPWMYKRKKTTSVDDGKVVLIADGTIRFSVMGNPHNGVAEGKVSVDTLEEFEYVKRLMEEGK